MGWAPLPVRLEAPRSPTQATAWSAPLCPPSAPPPAALTPDPPTSLTSNLKRTLEPAASGALTPPVPASRTVAPVPQLLIPGEARGGEIPASGGPFLPAPLVWSPGATPAHPQAQRHWGQGRGPRSGVESAEPKDPGASVPAGPTHPPSAFSRGLPPPLALQRRRERDPVPTPAQDPPDVGIRTKKPGCSGERGRTAPVWQVNTRGRLAATLPTLPRLGPPGRDTPSPLSRLPGDAAAARRARALRGSGSRLTGSGELDSVRAPAGARWPPGLRRAQGPRGCSRGRPLGKVRERHRLSRAPAPSPSESQRDRGSEFQGRGAGKEAATRSRTPPPAPRRRRREPLAARDARGHKDLVPAAGPSFSPSDRLGGLRPRSPGERTDGQTDRRAPRLRHPRRHALFRQPGCPRPPAPSPDPPWRCRASGETRGKPRPRGVPQPGGSDFRGSRQSHKGGGRGSSPRGSPTGHGPGTSPRWLRVQNPEPKFSL